MTEQVGQPKIFAPVDVESSNLGGETMFAIRIRDGVYRVDCVPLFADLHHGDIVRCDESEAERLPRVLEVLERANARTIHLLLTPKGARVSEAVIEAIRLAGAYIEQVGGMLYAINVHDDELQATVAALDRFPSHLRWWFDGSVPDTVTPPA